MDFERPPNLRTAGSPPAGAASQTGARFGDPPPINALAELVADLLASTGLVPADKLAMVRGGAGQGSFAQALIEQDVATSEGVARTLAARYQMPLIDLALTGVDDEAANQVPLHVLERIVAMRRLARASEAFGARAMVEEELAAQEEEESDDLEVDDGISDAPLVRLVNSVIFQAAEDGASDVHFEPQEDSLLV